MENCQKEKWNDKCCCNCKHQAHIFKHPWNHDIGKGKVTDLMGHGCMGLMGEPGADRQIVFMDTEHGICEMHGRIVFDE